MATDVVIRWVNGAAMLADSLTKAGFPSRHIMENFLKARRWRCQKDETFGNAKKKAKKGEKMFDDLTAFEELISNDLWSDDTKDLFRMRYRG